ncbi:UDP-N-acetylmuramoyl-tripeptide--D-alanyl-D-alanine ligase [Mucilaginibacter limnophilus]|uniref:UDP-N-acetylmuramoyl-tripeptide--D-alanyl-D-alanine ligase n=1 Tax=Mucilaginibacter limnophilus TaxID=1932778 RepID=A0A437MU76_9SPHI|nr:UDP-N-acetylmuramoyl-tripeptide--D-alanyl-D-alanine ligase [Mucilaginibacter limnophilus]RVU01228.1 UDP-N-acetylmuramoyl-tripeptide--D-alanyl-D-alanine ligase [Mucilaginibacter limnophilus]
MTTDKLYDMYLKHPVISTDTRRITPGSLFFALKGDKFDANTFAAQAIAAGAAYAVIDNAQYKVGEEYILVDDVLTALQDLARYHRKQLQIPVVGLTGTNGKTTTKELINAVLSQHFKTQATQGNLNNHIGVPLTILTIDSTHQAAVIEMGANHQKEIEFLSSIANPSLGLITNVGKAHLEGFGGVEGVKKGKGELYDYLAARHHEGSVVFVNSDDATLMQMAASRSFKHAIYYGTQNKDNLISGRLIENSPHLILEWWQRGSTIKHTVKSQLTGVYNLDNILAAIAIGTHLGLTPAEICKGIEGYQPKNNRSQIVQTATNTLICDYYNANPSSMAVAIDNIDKITADKKVLILGDMFEMGDEAATEHKAIIEKALSINAETIFVGKEFYQQAPQPLKAGAFYKTTEDAISALQANPVKNATVLIKGSRGMALEKLVELF